MISQIRTQRVDPLLSIPESHQSRPLRGRVQYLAERLPRGLRYNLRNRTRSPECHGPAARGSRALDVGVEPPLQHVAFDNYRARNTAFRCALVFRANIDERRSLIDHRFVRLLWREPSQSRTRCRKYLLNVWGFDPAKSLPWFCAPRLTDHLVRWSFARNQLIALQVVFVHVAERRGIGMNADRGRERRVANIVGIIRTECVRLTWIQWLGSLSRAMFFQKSGRYDQCSRGTAVVVSRSIAPVAS